eukprot:TRINITY_DN22389_c0_g1_i1.p1 TRINITY_DN22389_c0_g1~~TRINITY_DN22389_c0_g1_i1.p1  ORF type:complete len:336 (+),score=65.57 TRINITY_DN22389_c0_g1_i1:112-1119(+)
MTSASMLSSSWTAGEACIKGGYVWNHTVSAPTQDTGSPLVPFSHVAVRKSISTQPVARTAPFSTAPFTRRHLSVTRRSLKAAAEDASNTVQTVEPSSQETSGAPPQSSSVDPFRSGKLSSKLAAKVAEKAQPSSPPSLSPPSPSSSSSSSSISTLSEATTSASSPPTVSPPPPPPTASPSDSPSPLPASILSSLTPPSSTPSSPPSAQSPSTKPLIPVTFGPTTVRKSQPRIVRGTASSVSPPATIKPAPSFKGSKKVLAALQEGREFQSQKDRAPANIFVDVQRTPEEIEADKWQFRLDRGQILLVLSFIASSLLMFATVWVVWKAGAIHYDEY